MGRAHKQKTRFLPQVPKNLKADGLDIEFSRELADQNDLEAAACASAADERQRKRMKNS